MNVADLGRRISERSASERRLCAVVAVFAALSVPCASSAAEFGKALPLLVAPAANQAAVGAVDDSTRAEHATDDSTHADHAQDSATHKERSRVVLLLTDWLERAAQAYRSEIAAKLSIAEADASAPGEPTRAGGALVVGTRGATRWIRFWIGETAHFYNNRVAGILPWLPHVPDNVIRAGTLDGDVNAFTEARKKADTDWAAAQQRSATERTAQLESLRTSGEADAKKKEEDAIKARAAEAKQELEKRKEATDKHIADGLKKLEDFERAEKAEKARKAEEALKAEAKRKADEARKAEDARKAAAAEAARAAETKKQAELTRAEEARKKAEEARKVAEADAARAADEARAADVKRQADAARAADDARAEAARKADAARKAEDARKAADAARAADMKRQADVAEAARKAEDARKVAEAETARKAEEMLRAEEARKADEIKIAQETERKAANSQGAGAKSEPAPSDARKPNEPKPNETKPDDQRPDDKSKLTLAEQMMGIVPPLPKSAPPTASKSRAAIASDEAASQEKSAASRSTSSPAVKSKTKRIAKAQRHRRETRIASSTSHHGRRMKLAHRGTSHAGAVHVVRRGETLWKIANRYTGAGWRYETLYHLNRRVIRDPDHINPELVLRIPKGWR